MEATVVCIDNSEWTRSGDFAPSRFQAQSDAVNLLAGVKTDANPENTVGVLAMAGKGPRVLVTPTPELGKVLNAMTEVQIEGECNISASVQIAQLALKHRQNKNQRQRIVLFVGSPVAETQERLVKIAKKLKKNNVAVDVVTFGSDDENNEKLLAFKDSVSSNNNSHLVTAPAGCVLSDILLESPVFQGEEGSGFSAAATAAGAAAAAGGAGFEFPGVDPNLDPELALALRMSLEEERARQEAANKAAQEAGGEGGGEAKGGSQPETVGGDEGGVEPMDSDNTLLQEALAMSMQMEDTPGQALPGGAGDGPGDAAGGKGALNVEDLGMDIDDPELQAALQMSMQGGSSAAGADASAAGTGSSSAGIGEGANPSQAEYYKSMLEELPGVDVDDPTIQEALNSLPGGNQEGSKPDKESGEQS